MKLGELKLECLRLMAVNDEKLFIDRIEEYKSDELYKYYLDRMNGSINRALSRFMLFKVLPFKTKEIKPSECETLGQYLKLNLKVISDLNSIERIIYINEDAVYMDLDFKSVGENEILINFNDLARYKGKEEKIVITYSPNVMIEEKADEGSELDIPETLARIIPYFVKGELYELDEPNVSANARNIFESALNEYVAYGKPKKARQQYVKNTLY